MQVCTIASARAVNIGAEPDSAHGVEECSIPAQHDALTIRTVAIDALLPPVLRPTGGL